MRDWYVRELRARHYSPAFWGFRKWRIVQRYATAAAALQGMADSPEAQHPEWWEQRIVGPDDMIVSTAAAPADKEGSV